MGVSWPPWARGDGLEAFAIPVEEKFVIYRPLLPLAFVGNRAMAELTLELARREPVSAEGVPEQVAAFLRAVGFLRPDPPPPAPPDPAYRPSTAVLLLTNRCNLRCTYCYADGGKGPAEDLPMAVAQAVIDQAHRHAREKGAAQFELTFHGGGEPVQAWGALRAATAYARSKSLPCEVTLVSNGVWTARQREWILDNLDGVTISCDGTQATQDRQRPLASGRGSFRAVMRTIQALDRAHLDYGIRLTATAPWQGRLAEDVRFICEETGCPAMQVEPAFNTRRGEHQVPGDEQALAFAEAFLEAFEVAGEAGRSLTYSGARPWLLTQAFCTAPYQALVANAAGNLVACYEVAAEDHSLAGLSSLGRVAAGEVRIDDQARRAFLAYLDERRAGCRGCFCRWHCAGDCYARTASRQREKPWKASPRCRMNREITARLLLWYIMAGDGVWRGQGANAHQARLLRAF